MCGNGETAGELCQRLHDAGGKQVSDEIVDGSAWRL